jgi:hypothetical protein
MYATLNAAQINLLKLLRTQDESTRKQIKADLFAQVKNKFGIPDDHKLKVEIDATSDSRFAVLVRKTNDSAYRLAVDGKWVDADRPTVAGSPPADPRRWIKAVDDAQDFLEDEAERRCTDDDIVDDPDDIAALDALRASTGQDHAVHAGGLYVFMDPGRL